jgi:hypothetical protein
MSGETGNYNCSMLKADSMKVKFSRKLISYINEDGNLRNCE